MEKKYVSCDDLPDTLSKEQFYKICHISKKTASDLLNGRKVPCIKSNRNHRAVPVVMVALRLFGRIYTKACTITF